MNMNYGLELKKYSSSYWNPDDGDTERRSSLKK